MERSVNGTAVLDKAVAILDALAGGPLALSTLAETIGISRPTAHRLCAALEHHRLVVRTSDDRRALGPRLGEWARLASSDEHRLIEAAAAPLRQLRDATGESVQLYVRDGDGRRCVAGLESLHGLRTIVEIGALLPLDVGSAGAILRGDPHAVKRGWAQSVEEREKGVASVSAPVMINGGTVAAVSVSGPIDRTTRNPGTRYRSAVVAAGEGIAKALSSRV